MNFKEHTKINDCGNISVVDIGAKVRGGGRPPCFKIGNRACGLPAMY